MLWLLAILLPPVAVLFIGKPLSAVLNLLLTLMFFVPGMIHALVLVNEYKTDKRFTQLARSLRQ
ncbi:MAG: YqaE/Pmp3 family membrane protein [Pirellulales bacterium]